MHAYMKLPILMSQDLFSSYTHPSLLDIRDSPSSRLKKLSGGSSTCRVITWEADIMEIELT